MLKTPILLMLGLMISCTSRSPKDLSKETIIPKPATVHATGSSFLLENQSGIYYDQSSDQLASVGGYLSSIINQVTGQSPAVQATSATPSAGNIFLKLAPENKDLGAEGYQLDITEDLVTITGATAGGVFMGAQTLRQLMPATKDSKNPVEIATGTISDAPDYAYRGVMLDVARHFFQVDEVKRLIDLMAVYKLNMLHLHLSDDQGWRIEIKSWPNLTAHGGTTEVGGGEGGFYTQEQYNDLVKYASEHFITVIPEIDMPGHTNAALASYAELNCDEKARELYTGTNVGFSTLCTDKEITYKFIDDVVGELADMTPGPYLHIGGDESHVTPMEDYIPFVERVQKIVSDHGKKIIGWDEIANSNLLPNTTVQYWAKADNALKGVEKGAQVLMSPADKTYLDMQYDSTTQYGLHWAAYIEVQDAYDWDPASLVKGISRENILGVESPLWSETITNIKEAEFMIFPRLICHAEIGWTKPEQRSWEDFKNRLASQTNRLKALDINFYPSSQIAWQ